MVVRAKDAKASDAFRYCDTSHRKELYDVVSNYGDIFQEPSGFPPKQDIQHEIHLQQDASFPNLVMYKLSTI